MELLLLARVRCKLGQVQGRVRQLHPLTDFRARNPRAVALTPMRLTRLAPHIFDQVAADTRLGDQARGMARAVLVDGRAQADVATEYGMTKQRIGLAVTAIRRTYAKSSVPGWGSMRVELDLSESLALELGALAEALVQSDDASLKQAVIEKVLAATKGGCKRLALSAP